MRIAYLTQPYPPMISGAAIVAEQLAKGMAQCGHEALVIAASDTGQAYQTREPNFTVLRLPSFRNPMRVKQRLLAFPHRAIMKALREFQPQIIHAHEPAQTGLLGLRYGRSAKIPVLLTAHQLPWFVSAYLPEIPLLRNAAEKMAWNYAQWLTRRFSSVISPTKTISEILQSRTGSYVATLHYGIDLCAFSTNALPGESEEIRARHGIPEDAPILLHVGRLDMDKNVEHVLLAAERVIQTSNAHLLVIGDGSRRNTLVSLAKSLSIESRVHFTGFIAGKNELAKYYRSASVFVTASEIETQGIVLLEAAACGLPIAAVRATCIPEIVHDDRTGFLADPADIPSLSRAIARTLHRSKTMQRDCRKLAEQYSLEQMIAKHEAFYLRLMEFEHAQAKQPNPAARLKQKVSALHNRQP